MKRIISSLLVFVMAVTSFCMPNVKAEKISEPVVMDKKAHYVNTLNSLNSEDVYTISIPSNGYIKFKYYMGTNSSNGANYKLYNSDEEKVGSFNIYSYTTKSKALEYSIAVKPGNYKLYINRSGSGRAEYHFSVSYSMNMSEGAKISALKKKARITVPKNGKITGYDVRYKQKGTSKWKTKSFNTKKNLNTVISGLKSNKKYTFQIRKKAVDSYGHKYTSEWSKSQTVKIK